MISGLSSARSSATGCETHTLQRSWGTVAKPATVGTPSTPVNQATPVRCAIACWKTSREDRSRASIRQSGCGAAITRPWLSTTTTSPWPTWLEAERVWTC